MLVLEELIARDVTDVVINGVALPVAGSSEGGTAWRLRVRDHGRLKVPDFGEKFAALDLDRALKHVAERAGINPKRSLPQYGEYVEKKHKIEVSYLPALSGPSWAIHINHTDRAVPSLIDLKVPLKTRTAIWRVLEEGRGLIIAPIEVLYAIAATAGGDLMTIEDRARYTLPEADQYIITSSWTQLAPRALKVALKRRPTNLLVTRLDGRTLAESTCDYAARHLVLAGVPSRVKKPRDYLASLGVPEYLLEHVLKVVVDD